MSNNLCYAYSTGKNPGQNAQNITGPDGEPVACRLYVKDHPVKPHVKQATGTERRQRRRDIAKGLVEPSHRQRWDEESRRWVRL